MSTKARRYHLEADWNGVVVVVPKRWDQRMVDRLVNAKSSWIKKQISKLEKEKKADHKELIKQENLSRVEILRIFEKEVTYWSKVIEVKFKKISIRAQKSRWGSCSREGNLNFNLHLANAPAGVREYVIIHELCHLLVRNHSNKFWNQVRKFCPDFEIPRKWLRQNGRILTNSTLAKAGLVHR